MPEPLKLGIVGIGRIGAVHALHIHELARETGTCSLAALVDFDPERARRFAKEINCDAPIFGSVEEYAQAGICRATVIVTPTENHREHAAALIAAGHQIG